MSKNFPYREASPEDRIRAGGLLEAAVWTFAKTMPHNPHFWSSKKEWADVEAFAYVVGIINSDYKKVRFGNGTYRVWDWNGFRYWTMDWTLASTNLINRRVLLEGEGRE